jgi:hypothetical protein
MTVPPKFELVPGWARIPANFSVGDVAGIAVDAHDHLWLIHRSEMSDAGPRRPRKPKMTAPGEAGPFFQVNDDEPQTPPPPGAVPAPPVMEFDPDGNYLRGWGGPGVGYDWPMTEHSMHVDYEGNLWFTSGNGDAPNGEDFILKFTRDGEFLMQIGRRNGCVLGSLDQNNVRGAADLRVHPKTDELFVADGYVNRRVVVFDAHNGEFKRMWGAYGNVPNDNAPLGMGGYGEAGQQFRTVHGINVSNDDLVYVADRRNNRVQVFELDGTYVTEAFYDRDSQRLGTAFSVAFSPDPAQTYMYVPDGSNGVIRVIERKSLKELDSFGSFGLSEGQLQIGHSTAVDSVGNLFTSEVIFNQRVQKWALVPGTGTV